MYICQVQKYKNNYELVSSNIYKMKSFKQFLSVTINFRKVEFGSTDKTLPDVVGVDARQTDGHERNDVKSSLGIPATTGQHRPNYRHGALQTCHEPVRLRQSLQRWVCTNNNNSDDNNNSSSSSSSSSSSREACLALCFPTRISLLRLESSHESVRR